MGISLKLYKFRSLFRLISFSIILLWPQAVLSQPDPIKILFIGNSFTFNNNLPQIERELARETGFDVQIANLIAMGKSMNYFAGNTITWSAISSEKWDYIILQDNQRFYYGLKGRIDSMGHSSKKIMSNNLKMQDSIKKLIPCVKIIYFAGWEQCGGMPNRFHGDNTIKLIRRIMTNYTYLNNRLGVHNIIAPIGYAWINCLKQRPDLEEHTCDSFLFQKDGRHPGNVGSYLTACVLFSTIFHQQPIDIDTFSFPKHELKKVLKQMAWSTVNENFKYSNLKSVTPIIHSAQRGQIIYTSEKYTSYKWYMNDELIPSATSYKCKIILHGGTYRVETMDKKGCTYWSFPLFLSNYRGEYFMFYGIS